MNGCSSIGHNLRETHKASLLTIISDFVWLWSILLYCSYKWIITPVPPSIQTLKRVFVSDHRQLLLTATPVGWPPSLPKSSPAKVCIQPTMHMFGSASDSWVRFRSHTPKSNPTRIHVEVDCKQSLAVWSAPVCELVLTPPQANGTIV